MTSVVLDASALLALLLEELGADVVRAAIDGASLTAVNFAEVVSHYAKLGAAREDVVSLLRPLSIRIVAADTDLSIETGMLRPITLKCGLSLGDGYCLALAKREVRPALTAERRWPEIADAAAVEVRLIR